MTKPRKRPRVEGEAVKRRATTNINELIEAHRTREWPPRPGQVVVMDDAYCLNICARCIAIEHEAVGAALQTALAHAIVAGEYLLAAKRYVRHGQWLKWLAAIDIPKRTAAHYMFLAKGRGELCDQNGNVLPISVNKALHVLKNTNPWPGDGFSGHDSEWGEREPWRGWGLSGWGRFGENLRTVLDLPNLHPPAACYIVKAYRAGKTPALTPAALREAIALLTRYADALEGMESRTFTELEAAE
jgi:hypothetical protein